jgi:hypothetical protein
MLPFIIMSWLLQAAETTNFNSATTILTWFSLNRLPPSWLTTMLLNVILRYFNLTILSPFSSLGCVGDRIRFWNKRQDGYLYYIYYICTNSPMLHITINSHYSNITPMIQSDPYPWLSLLWLSTLLLKITLFTFTVISTNLHCPCFSNTQVI